MEEILKLEEELTFKSFNSKDALRLGQMVMEMAEEMNETVAMEIYYNSRPVFLYIPDGLSPDKADWLRRKRNSVIYFGHSTGYVNLKCKGDDQNLLLKYARELKDYTCTLGSLPIIIEGLGVVGAATVTGLKPEEDQNLIAKCLKKLKEEKHHE